jgi:hypothetical protein
VKRSNYEASRYVIFSFPVFSLYIFDCKMIFIGKESWRSLAFAWKICGKPRKFCPDRQSSGRQSSTDHSGCEPLLPYHSACFRYSLLSFSFQQCRASRDINPKSLMLLLPLEVLFCWYLRKELFFSPRFQNF